MTGTAVTTDPPRTSPFPPDLVNLTREQADAELAALAASIDAISASLLDLENHPGHQLLRSYPQSGRTEREWSELRDALAGLWEDFARLRSVAESARAVRDRHSRPDGKDLAELTYLLHGFPIELSSQAVPLSQRTLTGPAATSNRIGLAGLTARMNAAFELAGDLVTQVDTVATTVREGLGPLQEALTAGRSLAGPGAGTAPGAGAEPDPADPDVGALAALDDRIVELTRRSVSDALSIADPAGEIAAIADDLLELQARLERAATLRAGWPEKVAGLRELAVQIGATQQRGRRARELVAQTIRTSALPEPVDRLRAVNSRIDALETTPGWPARIRGYRETQRMAQDELAAAAADEQLAAGLLQRRTELRGRLSAYRSKAIRLGRVPDPTADAQYERAAVALAETPCDLRAATTLVAGYQDLVLGPVGRTPGGPA